MNFEFDSNNHKIIPGRAILCTVLIVTITNNKEHWWSESNITLIQLIGNVT